jgi:hypothetical protein
MEAGPDASLPVITSTYSWALESPSSVREASGPPEELAGSVLAQDATTLQGIMRTIGPQSAKMGVCYVRRPAAPSPDAAVALSL